MFPYRDEIHTFRFPAVTLALIGANVAVWLMIEGLGSEPALSRSICLLGLIPGEFLQRIPAGSQLPVGPGLACVVEGSRNWLTPLSSMFMHGGWLHLIGNMWFLWIFGDNVEDAMGPGRYLLFYLLCGLAAASAQMLAAPSSPIPMVGASGAISGVMGAYVLLYPKVRVRLLVFLAFYVTTIAVPAYLMVGYWFLLQLLGAVPRSETAEGGVAFWAHIGGFVAGVVLVKLFEDPRLVARQRQAISLS
ncbi:MAG: rhomboid family intramembrane serine protease [Gemmatimonadota bacterium]